MEEYMDLPWIGKADVVLLYPSLLLILVIFYIVWYHYVNESFYRQFLKIWEDNIKEDFMEEFTRSRKKRCCIEITSLMRYFSYREWISLWRMKGQVLPKSE